jgi:AraC family transcriptional activator FtrA
LLIHIVRKDYGAKIANTVARRLVIPPHRDGGQAQFIPESVPLRARSEYGPLCEYLLSNLRRPHTLAALAQRLHVSERTLIRGFRNATGVSPMQWLIRTRVRKAQELLETSGLSIDRIASEVGFGAPETLRHHFRRITGTSPAAFRKAFSG